MMPPLLLTTCLLLLSLGACIEHDPIPVYPDVEFCNGRECYNKMWCWHGSNYVDVRKLWSDVSFELSFVRGDPCVITASDDGHLNKESFLRRSGESAEELLEWKESAGLADRLYQAVEWFSPCKNGFCVYKMSPYRTSCVKLCPSGARDVKVEISATQVNKQYAYPALLFIALGLIYISKPLSERVAFYYITGTSLGVVLSVFIIVYFTVKRVNPRASPAIGVLFAASIQSMLGVFSYASEWLQSLLKEHIEYIAWYIAIAAVVSFAITHYMLKGEDGVSVSAGIRDIVQWAINLIGLVIVFQSTSSVFWSLVLTGGVVVALIIQHPVSMMYAKLYSLLDMSSTTPETKWVNTPYLTKDEYKMQGEIMTEKHVQSLVDSPGFRKWMAMNSDRIVVTPRKESLAFDSDDDTDM